MLMARGWNSGYVLPVHCYKTLLNIRWVIWLPCATLFSLQDCKQGYLKVHPKKALLDIIDRKRRAGLSLFKLWLCWNYAWSKAPVWKSHHDWGHPQMCDRGSEAETCHPFTAEHLFSPSLYNQT